MSNPSLEPDLPFTEQLRLVNQAAGELADAVMHLERLPRGYHSQAPIDQGLQHARISLLQIEQEARWMRTTCPECQQSDLWADDQETVRCGCGWERPVLRIEGETFDLDMLAELADRERFAVGLNAAMAKAYHPAGTNQ